MQARSANATIIGQKQGENEDTLLVDDQLGLYIVCDGMGGHKGGKRASSMACQAVAEFLKTKFQAKEGVLEAAQLSELVEQAVQHACAQIFRYAAEHSECHGMGTTLSMVLLGFNWAVVGHVGDSRVYLARDGVLDQLTKDHTVVQEMVDQGALPASSLRTSPYAHVLSRALGVQESVRVDVMELELLPGDRLIVCSDGVSDAFHEVSKFKALINSNTAELPQALIDAARKAGSKDDAGVIVVEISAPTTLSAEERKRVERVKLSLETLRGVYLFSDLSTDELLRVMALCQVRECAKGDNIVRKGDIADSIYMIIRGNFEVNDASIKLNTLSEGSHFGEMGLLSGGKRNADVRAAGDGLLLRLDYLEFMALVNQDPRLGVKLLTALSKELSARLANMNLMFEGQRVK